ncbi:hypothetical protein RRG08_021273 [Elysia crispata]|uniref:Uncharacterized protein n=1 Tax=Elysia crispata TaxID=231223 RepID=A0AAE0ZA51_9GAST|nr:hypothetical protein RRG08_021273 [Elysia crispata]
MQGSRRFRVAAGYSSQGNQLNSTLLCLCIRAELEAGGVAWYEAATLQGLVTATSSQTRSGAWRVLRTPGSGRLVETPRSDTSPLTGIQKSSHLEISLRETRGKKDA